MDPRARTALNASMARLADGDRDAFAAVYESLRPVLRSFYTRASRSEADGQDAAQQALLKVFARASTDDSARDAITWALSIAAASFRKRRERALARLREAWSKLYGAG